MELKDIERRQVAAEWDMGWFCDNCECLRSWKTKAYIIGNKKLCENCARENCEKQNFKR